MLSGVSTCRAIAALCVGLLPFVAGAQEDAVAKPGEFQTTGGAGFTYVDQNAPDADAIRETLKGISLPDGFSIELYALVPDARHMAMSPQGKILVVGTRKSKVWAVMDRNSDNVADEVKDFAPALNFDAPNGVAWSNDGFLFIAERNRVMMFPDAEFFWESPDLVAVPIVPKGALVPVKDESYAHSARVVKIGPDNKVYVSLGQPFNVTPEGKVDQFLELGIGGIIRMDRDGSNREVYTVGIRNSVGHDFHPVTGELWFTDNQVDGMGDDIPAGELNHQTEIGQHFGFPWYGGGTTPTTEYAGQEIPFEVIDPVVETVAHAADLGMTFYAGEMFPKKYTNAIFSAQHGSWNRTTPIGARVMVTFIDGEGVASMQPFAEGWLNANGEYDGRPVDVHQMKDGSLLVSDDFASAIYRITYSE